MVRGGGTCSIVTTEREIEVLRSRVMDPGRVHPIVVVVDDSGLDGDELARALHPHCDVFQVSAERRADVVPPRWQSISMGGAVARVFPGRDVDWRKRPDLSRFFRAGASLQDVVASAREVVPGLAARELAAQRQAADRALDREASRQVVWIREVHGAHALAERLLDPGRQRPCAVVTVRPQEKEPLIDPQALLAVAPGEVEVYVLPTREMTYVLAEKLGREASVFGGAGRVYAPGTGWLHDPAESPLHLVDTYVRAQAATDRMIADVMREVAAVRFADHHQRSHSAAGAHDVFPLAHYTQGALVLARVMDVRADAATVELFPEVSVELSADDVTGNPLDRLDDLMTPDEVVVVRVIRRPPNPNQSDGWLLSLLDVDDDEAVLEAPAVRLGGGPWISLTDNETTTSVLPQREDDSGAATLQQAPMAPGPAEVARLRQKLRDVEAERDRWRKEAKEWRIDAQAYYAQAHDRSQQLQELRTRARKVRVQLRDQTRPNRAVAFSTAEEEFRWQVFITWTEFIPAGEKGTHRLPQYWIGPDFIESVERLGATVRGKVLKTIVRVLLGMASDVHKLRTSDAGGAPPVTVNGAVCMRVPIEDRTPSARRLHYWQGPAGRIELSRLGVHDDYRPGRAPTFLPSAGGGTYMW